MNDIVSISKANGINIPEQLPPSNKKNTDPSKPLINSKHENCVTRVAQGMNRVDAFLLSYPSRKDRLSATKGVSQLFSRADVKARYDYLIEEQRKKGIILGESRQSGQPGKVERTSRDPDGLIDITTRAGRLSVVEMVVQDYLNGAAVRTDAVLKAVDRLVSMHGDQEALKAERSIIPVEAIVGHLIQCEVDGVDPLSIELDELPALLCKVFKLAYCTVASESEAHTHRVKGKEATEKELNAHKQGANDDIDMHTVCNDVDSVRTHEDIYNPQPLPHDDISQNSDPHPTPPAPLAHTVTPLSTEPSDIRVAPVVEGDKAMQLAEDFENHRENEDEPNKLDPMADKNAGKEFRTGLDSAYEKWRRGEV